ncbi:MAG: nicotinate-nucleotide--dimethylbenzimidazole phosphoribosyltransferase [Rhodospirillaceae bacterium]|nr:nicotinate-nucleotide--dimethylbenzimidazole phosphoribosyltransferase [Rhodospirillaceae bacterium]|tara:strand:+ start:4779 stop:5831 length:1053 start_codon:yes stop_codon:yes gene_type:complete
MEAQQSRQSIASLDEVRSLIGELPGPNLECSRAAKDHEAELTKPAGALGRLEEMVEWLAAWQGTYPPRLVHPRTAVFAGNHGIVRHNVSAFPGSVTGQMVQNFIAGGAAVNQLCRTFDADLRVYELGLEEPTGDFTQTVAMSDEECVRAMAYGMMSVEPGLDVLCLGEMGIGNTTSASAVSFALFGGRAEEWVGLGTGISKNTLRKKIAVVEKGCALHTEKADDPLSIFAALGGLELAAIIGAILAARLARVPVILDGFACTTAAAVIFAIQPKAIDHCLVSHCSVEPGHQRLLEKLGKKPLLNLEMRLGEGSGATLALGILRAALDCHLGMATFGSAGIQGPVTGKTAR